MFMSLTEAEHMSLMNDFQVVFHSYFTIWTKVELAFDRIFCIDFDRFSMAPYSSTRFTIYDFIPSLWSSGNAYHFC